MFHHAWLLPLLAFLTTLFGSLVPYGLAVVNDDVYPVWPYLSDIGDSTPESCVFAQFMAFSAFLLAICIYLRHRLIVAYYKHVLAIDGPFYILMSRILLGLGWVSAVGLLMIACFQESSLTAAHVIGTVMAFGIGLAYCAGQVLFGYRMKPHMTSRLVLHMRLLIVIVNVVLVVLTLSTGFITMSNVVVADSINTTVVIPSGQWSPDYDGYEKHIASTISEWSCILFFQIFILSFSLEFRYIDLRPIIVVYPAKATIQATTQQTTSNGDNQFRVTYHAPLAALRRC